VLSQDRLVRNEDKMSGYFELGVETYAFLGMQNSCCIVWRSNRRRDQRIHVSMLLTCLTLRTSVVLNRQREAGGATLGIATTCPVWFKSRSRLFSADFFQPATKLIRLMTMFSVSNSVNITAAAYSVAHLVLFIILETVKYK
jgi:hypothetical protein